MGAHEELRAFARKGVGKAAGRYDPSKGPPFQAYAKQDIYWETRRGAEALLTVILQQEALQEEARQGRVPDEVDQEAESALEELPGRDLEDAFERIALDQWPDIIKGLSKEELSTLRSLLSDKKPELTRGDPKRERNYRAILANVIEQGIVLDLNSVRKRVPNAKFVEILGPLRVASIREQQKSKRLPAETVSYSNLSRLLTQHGKLFDPAYSVSDKTVKKWDKRIAENPDYEEHELLDRLHDIVDPRGGKRLQRRRQSE